DLPVTINLTQLLFGKGFLPNKSIEINGVVLAKPYLFVVYLFEDGVMYKTADMPLYFKPKLPLAIDLVEVGFGKGFLPDKYIEINGRITNVRRAFYVYLLEGPYPKADEPFRFASHHQIRPQIVLDSCQPTFNRADLSKISHLYIYGAEQININSLILCTKHLPTTTPPRPPQLCTEQIELNNLTIPSIIKLVDKGLGIGFTYPKLIIIFGTPTAPTRFDISMAEEGVPEETADIPFHFSADFAQKKVSE
uniref:Galectin domain-containing protein n=1 Tax=Meloidogyne javanica TaxID=6303 RepID=A0A915LMC8_MELJA